MTKFKVGDKVRCIRNPTILGTKGLGWKEGLEYEITAVTNPGRYICYFGGNCGSGVYEPFLELVDTKVTDWKQRISGSKKTKDL